MLKDIRSGALPVEEIPGFIFFLLKNFLFSWNFAIPFAAIVVILILLSIRP